MPPHNPPPGARAALHFDPIAPGATPIHIATRATNAMVALASAVNTLNDESAEIRAEQLLTSAKVARLEEAAERIERRLDGEVMPPRAHRDMRRPLPSLSEYNPDYTPAGGIKLDPDEFAKLQRHVAEQDERARIAEAEKRGAEKALAASEAAKKKADDAAEKATKDANEARERAQRRRLYWLSFASAGGAVAAYVLSHVFHF